MKTKTPLFILILLIAALLATACSPSAAKKLNQNGNDAYTQEAYQEALAMYQSAQIKEPELAQPYYNAANALYRQGEYEAALQQLQLALTFAEDETLAQSSLFNLGNSSFNAQDLGTAVAAYTEALLLNPDDQDAKYNLELALQQQQEQQSENGESEEEQEQNQDQQDQSEGGEGQKEQQDQQSGEDQSENGQEGDQQQESEQSENGERQNENQEQEGDQQQNGQPDQGDQQQDQQQPGQGQPGQEDPNGEQNPGYVPQPGERMTAEQAQQLLAAIAGNSDTLQERLGQMLVVPWGPPAQDW